MKIFSKISKQLPNIFLVETPLTENYLAILRNQKTNRKLFVSTMKLLSILLVSKVGDVLPTFITSIETPIAKTNVKILKNKFHIISILRGGLGMLSGFLLILNSSKVSTIGCSRNPKTFVIETYDWNIQKIGKDEIIFVLDPLLATGNTLDCLLTKLIKITKNPIFYCGIIASKIGINRLAQKFPTVNFWTLAIDLKLNDQKYIVPGLGDAGDRYFGKK